MIRTTIYRLALGAVIGLSAFCFLQVNQSSAAASARPVINAEVVAQEDKEEAARSLPMPDLALLEKALELLQKVL